LEKSEASFIEHSQSAGKSKVKKFVFFCEEKEERIFDKRKKLN
jgi:hypothetical protein